MVKISASEKIIFPVDKCRNLRLSLNSLTEEESSGLSRNMASML